MNRNTLSFIALAVTMIYGVSFVVIDGDKGKYAVIGGVVVALMWIAVGRFGKDDTSRTEVDS